MVKEFAEFRHNRHKIEGEYGLYYEEKRAAREARNKKEEEENNENSKSQQELDIKVLLLYLENEKKYLKYRLIVKKHIFSAL